MGATASINIPMHVDLETFRKLSGSTFNDPIFNQFAVDGVMSRDKLLELSKTTDCILSFDEQDEGAAGMVMAVNQFLQSRGLVTWFSIDPCGVEDRNNRIPICEQIDRTRSFIFFVSRGYVERVCAPNTDTSDRCFTEFNYALRRKFPEKMIPVVLDPAFSESTSSRPVTGTGQKATPPWPGIMGPYFGPQGTHPSVDFTSAGGQSWESHLENLFHNVVKITRNDKAFMAAHYAAATKVNHGDGGEQSKKLQVHISGVAPLATREEAQFFLWMTRACPGIGDLSRTMYCSALTHVGVTTVQKLSDMMKHFNNFLILRAGAQEHDADEIALAISDLGLGYNPVRDFSTSSTIESAMYAMKKACLATGDPELAANALKCLARVVFTDPQECPKKCMERGLCDPAVKLLSRYLGDFGCVEAACRALESMGADEAVAERLGDFNACDIVPRALQSHLTKPTVVEAGLKLIAVLSKNTKNNKHKFGTAGACDVVCRGLSRHVELEQLAYYGCEACHNLAIGYGENVGKLAYSQGCEILTKALATHPTSAGVTEMAFKSMILLAVDAEYRSRMGAAGACEATITALQHHADLNPQVVESGLVVHNTLIIGNANNRSMLGRSGACELIQRVLTLYDPQLYPVIVQHACTAVYSLASGSPENQRRLLPLIPYVQGILRELGRPGSEALGLDAAASERMRSEAQEALIRLTNA